MDELEIAMKNDVEKENRVTWRERKETAYEKELLNGGKEEIISDHHTICLQLRQCYMSIISKSWG